jgi:hypothetical protein
MVSRGQVKPIVSAAVPLEEPPRVHEEIAKGRTVGRVVLEPWLLGEGGGAMSVLRGLVWEHPQTQARACRAHATVEAQWSEILERVCRQQSAREVDGSRLRIGSPGKG